MKENKQEQHQFHSYYCAGCRQRKPCQLLTGWDSEWRSYCCWCYYENQKRKAENFHSYDEVLTSKLIEREKNLRQLQLLSRYAGCSQCRSKEVDAYYLYEHNRLVCQPCLAQAEGGSSSPISFAEQSQWYKKRWGINLGEWVEIVQRLPVNKSCAEQWQQDSNHLNYCRCLEVESQEIYLLFTNSLVRNKERLEQKCQCIQSQKIRTPYYDKADYGYTYCEQCQGEIKGAGKHGIIKNRNDPRFWGLEVKEKVLCGKCLGQLKEQMPVAKQYTFNKYQKRGYFNNKHYLNRE